MSSAGSGRSSRPDESMTLITEMMERPLDPGYAAAAERRQASGLPPATSLRSPMLIAVAVLVGALLAISALALRAPDTGTNKVKSDLVGRIEDKRAHADSQTRAIATLQSEINAAQAAALSLQSETGLAAELSTLELASGTVAVTGPGVVLTVDDAPAEVNSKNTDVDPRTDNAPDQTKVIARDLQIIVNGLWQSGAEAISINGHRLTVRASIRFAGAAILVDYRPLKRPYVITAIGEPGNLSVEFADSDGGRYLQSLKANFTIRGDVTERDPVTVPGAPTLSLLKAKPLESAVTTPSTTTPSTTTPSTTTPSTTTPRTTTRDSSGRTSKTAPQTTETSP